MRQIYKIPSHLVLEFQVEAERLSHKSNGKIEIFPLGTEKHDNIEYTKVFVDGEFPAFQEWEFVAQILKNKDKNIVVPVNHTVEICKEWYNPNILTNCDHCHHNRKRVCSYVIRKIGSYETTILGSTCVKPFFNGMTPDKLATFFENLYKFRKKLAETERKTTNINLDDFAFTRNMFATRYQWSSIMERVFGNCQNTENLEKAFAVFRKFYTEMPEEIREKISTDDYYINVYGSNFLEVFKNITSVDFVRWTMRFRMPNNGKTFNVTKAFSGAFNLFRNVITNMKHDNYYKIGKLEVNDYKKIAMQLDLPFEEKKEREDTELNTFVCEVARNASREILTAASVIEEKAMLIRKFSPKHSNATWTQGLLFLTESGHFVVVFIPYVSPNAKRKTAVEKLRKCEEIKKKVENNCDSKKSIVKIKGKVNKVRGFSNLVVYYNSAGNKEKYESAYGHIMDFNTFNIEV